MSTHRFAAHPYAGRREDARLLTGAGRYTADWNLSGQAHAAFLRSDHAHAEILSVEIAAASALPGVVAILTGEDAVAAGYDKCHVVMPVPGRDGPIKVPARPVLAHGRVRYVGEPVALVVAETAAQAMDAAEAIEVRYRALPCVVDAARALAADAPRLFDAIEGNLCFDYEYGDEAATNAAFAAAAHVVSLDLTSDRVVGNPMEPKAALARWDGAWLDIWAGTQGMTALRDSFAAQSGLAASHIRARAQDVGGGFGIRGSAYPEYLALALAALRAGRPVKWVATRSETFLSDYHGRGLRMRGELALDADGRFLAIRHQWIGDQGAYPVATGPLINSLNPAMMCIGCYDIPLVHGRHRLALTNTVPITAYRGAGRPDMAYVVERLVDEAAALTGLDRVELRRRNLIGKDRFPHRLPTGKGAAEYDSGDYVDLMDTALASADWPGFASRRVASETAGKLRGIGCAVFVEPAGGVVPKDEVAITFDEDGSAVLHSVVVSSGQGHETVFPEIVARILQIDPHRIRLSAGDPEGPALAGGGAFASRSMMSHGAASSVAAHSVVAKGMALAADKLEAAAADIEYRDGVFRVVGTDRGVSLSDLARTKGALDADASLPSARAFPSGAHVVEVEIDPDTGIVEIQRYVAVDDCGLVLNHTLLEGQIQGGIAQGIGQVLGEVAIYEDASGQLQTASFMDYAMPRADLLRDLSISDRSVPSPSNPLGVKGAGEAGTTGALPATMNAIIDALRPRGIAHLDMPASAHRVWRALADASSTPKG